jgi:Ca-activated chloride channel family protein
MIPITFANEPMLWLLAAPAALLGVWMWRVVRRHRDVSRVHARRVVPVREQLRGNGELAFALGGIIASALLILAIARPVAPTTMPRRAGLDVIVLQDASASMRVTDVNVARGLRSVAEPDADRWQRSMTFLRELGDALSWTNDRFAMVTFARIAAPQIRLTRDPNTLFFFLDHLHARPPFRLEDETTWDTNLEEAVGWGLRVVEKDQEIHGRSANGTVFVMLSDGEAWSGEVAKAIARAVDRDIPIYVIGVGTLGGGPLPVVRSPTGDVLESPGTSRLERASLQRIAAAGHGDYFELDRDDDRHIANNIIAAGRRLAPSIGVQEVSEDLYWWFVFAATVAATASLLWLRQRLELGILLVGSVASAIVLGPILF